MMQEKEYKVRDIERVEITLPAGTRERIHKNGEAVSAYINRLILEDLGPDENDKMKL